MIIPTSAKLRKKAYNPRLLWASGIVEALGGLWDVNPESRGLVFKSMVFAVVMTSQSFKNSVFQEK